MKKILTILAFSLVSFFSFGQVAYKYIPLLEVDDVKVGQYFIWHGDTIDFNEVLSGVTRSDSTIVFVTPTQLMDSLAALGGGHDPVVLDGSAVLGGLSINGQLLGFTKASSTTSGYINANDYNTFNQKLNFVTHDETLLGNGQAAFPLKVDTTLFVTPWDLDNQSFLTDTGNFIGTWQGNDYTYFLDWNNLTNKPVISDDAYGLSWDGNLDAASKNSIYDAIQAALNSNVDSVYSVLDANFSVEHLYYAVDGISYYITSIRKPDGLDGGYVTWTGSLNFSIAPAYYTLSGTDYSSSTTSVTLSVADATYDRIDVFAVNDQGQAIVIEGTPAENPQKPSIDPSTQIELTYVLVQSGATEPSNPNTGSPVTSELVYDENTEWVTSGVIYGGTANFESTTNPYSGSVSANISTVRGGDYLTFLSPNGDNLNVSDINGLSFMLQLKAGISNQFNFYLSFLKDGFTVSNPAKLTINKSSTSWQLVGLDLTTVTFSGTQIDGIKLVLEKTGTNTSVNGFYLDLLQLQGNFTQTSTVSDITGNEPVFDGWDKDVSDDFSGDYNSLTNTPTIPTDNSELTNGAGYLTAEVDGSVTNEIQTLDVAQLSGTNLELSLSDDGEATHSIDLSSLISSSTDDQTASEVPITDTGDYYTSTDVETALQEAGADIATNNAKVSNATHTGEVTGDEFLTVSDGVIGYDNLAYDQIGKAENNTTTWDYSAVGIFNSTLSTNATLSFNNLQEKKELYSKITITDNAAITLPDYCKRRDNGSLTLNGDSIYYLNFECWDATSGSEDVLVDVFQQLYTDPTPPEQTYTSSLDSGLVALYELNETSGTLVEDCTGTNDGTQSGTIEVNQTGVLDGAYHFSGTGVSAQLQSDYLNIGNDASLDFDSKFTISAWVYPQNNTTGTYVIASKWYSSGGDLKVLLRRNGTNWQFYIATATEAQVGGSFTTTHPVTLNNWFHIVAIADGSNLKMIINGDESSTTYAYNGTIQTGSSYDWFVGSRQTAAVGYETSWNGLLDQVAFWDRDLTTVETDSLYNSGNGYAWSSCTGTGGGGGTATTYTTTELLSSVGYCWFSKPSALYNATADKGWIGLVHNSGSGYKQQIVQIDYADTTITTTQLGSTSDQDDHNDPAILVRSSDSRILTAYNYHNADSYLRFRLSTNPTDASSFGTEYTYATSGTAAYVNLFEDASGNIFCFYRENNSWAYIKSTDGGATWGGHTLFMDKGTTPLFYIHFVQSKTDADIIHMVNSVGHPENSSNVSIYGEYFDCSTESFYDLTNTEITDTKPFAMTAGTLILPATSPDGAWLEDIAVDENDVVRYLLTYYPDGENVNWINQDTYYAEWDGTTVSTPVKVWDANELNLGGSTQPCYSSLSVFDKNNPNIIYASIETNGVAEIYKVTNTSGTFSFEQLTTNSTYSQWRPITMGRPSGLDYNLFWLNRISYPYYYSYTQTFRTLHTN